MQATDISKQERHSRPMNEFDKFVSVDGESLTSVYERFSTLINIMDQNQVKPFEISINTKLLNSLQHEWSKYVTLTRQKFILEKEHYEVLYDYLSQFKPHMNASKAKKAARNHDPLALIANSYAHPSHSYASPSYSHSPQPYYVTHPSSVIDYEDDYQGEIQGDAQEDKISTAMMLLAQAITQHYSTPTNNRLRTSLNTRNQVVIQDGRVDIQRKNVGYVWNGNKNAGRKNRNQATNAGNGMVQKIEEYDQNRKSKTRVRDAKYFREQMLLIAKDEAGVNLDVEENDFMLMNSYGDDQLEELNASVIMMARIQPTDDKSNAEPTYDTELISEVNASQIDMINGLLSKSDHEHENHEKLETAINTSADDQIDSNIIFDDLYLDNNSRQDEHDSTAHDQPYVDIESLIYNVQVEVKEFEKKPVQFINYKSTYEDLQKQISVEQQNIEKLQNEKDEIRDRFLKARDESLKIKNETESFKKAFKVREDKYLDEIVTLEEKLKSHERVVFKMSHPLQTIHMLGTTPNSFYDPNMKAGLGYKNPKRLKKAIKAQPKMYNGKNLKYHELKVNLPDSKETLEDAEKSD
ncbi:hypothetical protein Tco_1243665 [Tanacetum coccineum]